MPRSRRTLTMLIFVVSVSLIAQADEPPQSDKHAASRESTPQSAIYHSDPQHLWNRLHAALFIRRGPDGRAYGDDRLEPLLWPGTRHLIERESRNRALGLLNAFIETRGERLVADPVKRAVLQRDLWLVVNWLEGDHQELKVNEVRASQRELIPRLANVIRRLSQSSERILELPDNYAAAVASNRFAKRFDATNPDRPFLPPDLFDEDGPWVCVGRADGPVAPEHLNNGGGNSFTNSAFLTFVRLPGGRAATLEFLDRLNAFDEALLIEADENWQGSALTPNPRLPALPAGTQVALVRQLLLIDSWRRIAPARLTESVQLRVYREVPPMTRRNFDAALVSGTEANRHAQSWQSFFEFRLSRGELFAGRAGGLVAVGPGERDFKTGFASHPWDEFDRPPAADRPFAETSQQIVRQTCFACHSLPGIYSLSSFFNFRTANLTARRSENDNMPRPARLVESSVADVRATRVRWEEDRDVWSKLRRHVENAVEPYDGWGPTINGLRLQLIAARKEYVVGGTMDLTLLLQNVSDKPAEIPAITLMPTIANGNDGDSHPYGDRHGYNTMISFRVPNGSVCILWQQLQSIMRMADVLRLGAGELHVATIRIPGIPPTKAAPERAHRVRLLRRASDEERGGGLTRHTASFPLSQDPGHFVLRARYHPGGLAKEQGRKSRQTASNWQDRILESNPVELVIVPEQEPGQRLQRSRNN